MTKKFSVRLSFLLATTLVSLTAIPSYAADSVLLKYSIFRETISVPELTTFAETGELSSSLKGYLNKVNKNPEDLRKVLTDKIAIDGVMLSKILNSIAGEWLLDQVSEVIHTPSNRASRQALRSALVTSALPDNQIQLIEVLENYPTSEVHVEGDRLVETYQLVSTLLEKIPKLPFFLNFGQKPRG